jgi:hypothetical protein
MPYIKAARRNAFSCTGDCEHEAPETTGELNYVLILAPYEDEKCKENGDVYFPGYFGGGEAE